MTATGFRIQTFVSEERKDNSQVYAAQIGRQMVSCKKRCSNGFIVYVLSEQIGDKPEDIRGRIFYLI